MRINKDDCELIKINDPEAIVAYGLFYKDELIESLSFGKPDPSRRYFSWEILSFYRKKGYTINGGKDKIWKYFLEDNSVGSCYCGKHCCEHTHKVDNQNIYFPDGIVYKITDLNTGKFYIGETFYKKEFLEGKYNGSGGKWRKYYEKYKGKHNFVREILKENFKTPEKLYEYEINEIRKYCIKLDNGNYRVDSSTGCMNTKTCMQSEMPVCPECGAPLFHHKKKCSYYTPPKSCDLCGKTNGQHKEDCPNAKRCGECNGLNGHHKATCSKYKKCPECGKPNNHHLKTCSHYKPRTPCPECGSLGRHKKSCSKSKWNEKCPICGLENGKHSIDCPSYNTDLLCDKCGGLNGHHTSDCPLYKEYEGCPECGSKTTHKEWCSKYKPSSKCPECGGKRGHHCKNCSQYVPQPPCPLCSGKNGHHEESCPRFRKREPKKRAA